MLCGFCTLHSAHLLLILECGGSALRVFGAMEVTTELEDHSKSWPAKVIIVDGVGPCLLGGGLIQSLESVGNIHKVSTSAHTLKKNFLDYFQKALGVTEQRTHC